MGTTELKIFKLLYRIKEPLTGYEIAKKCNTPISSTYYFLDKMVKKNIIVKIDGLYGLNPIFYDYELYDNLISALKKFMSSINEMETEYGAPDLEYTTYLLVTLLTEKSRYK